MSSPTDCTPLDIKIKAIGADNEAHIRELVDLFHECYGDSFPVQTVYEHQFWKSHIGVRFTSLVATFEGAVIAHIALFRSPENPSHVQVCLPACHPDFAPHLGIIGEGVKNVIQDMQTRQNWRMLYFFVLADMPQFHLLAGSILGTVETAICPNYFSPTGFQERRNGNGSNVAEQRTHVAITQRVFAPVKQEMRMLFAPDYHRDICQRLCNSLGLQRKFAQNGDIEKMVLQRNRRPLVIECAVSSDQPALQKALFSRTGVCHAFVQPSLVESAYSTLAEIERTSRGHRFVFVNMEDPACPEFCDAVEESGYRFCGVLPLLQGPDNIVYAMAPGSEFSPESFYTPRSRFLASYIESYTLSPDSNSNQLSTIATESGDSISSVDIPLPDGTYGI